MKALEFYVAKADEISRKYRGKHIAIVDDRVVAAGDNPKEVWEAARRAAPRRRPVLAYVPPGDIVIFVAH